MGGFSANTNNQPSGSDVVFASNVDFSGQANPASTMLTNGQLLIGSTALNAGNTHINVGNLVSPNGSITIGYSSPNITLVTAGGGTVAVDSFAMQTGTSPVIPDVNGLVTFNGSRVAAGTNPVRTNGTAANTMQLEVQISQAIAATDATKIGLSNFNSSHFSVDANGFVALIGGGQAADSFAMQTGTSPVVPDGNGLVTFNGSRVAAGTNPVRTNGTGANTMQLEVQISQAIASTDATKIGLSNFDSAGFDVDANGFVTLNNIPNPATQSILFDDFIYSVGDVQVDNATSWGPFGISTSGGTPITQTNASNHPGIIKITSTATTSLDYLVTSATLFPYGPAAGNYAMTFEWMMKIDVLSAANPSYILYMGCWDNGGTIPANGFYFKYTHGTNSGNWQMLCTDGGGTTTANSSTAADTNWHRFKITVNAAGTSVGFFIDNVQLANSPIATHITTNKVGLNMVVSYVAGAASKSFNFDYYYAKFAVTR